jgi:endonuclease/exonuclease/phosphatase (EEP) superfamily protein YafD
MIRIATLLFLTTTTACITGEFTDEQEPIDDDAAALGGAVNIRIVQHNVEKRLDVIQSTLAKAMSSGAEAITLQEVCPDQLNWLTTNYGSRWTIAAISGKKPALKGCDLPNGQHDIPTNVAIVMGKDGSGAKPYPVLGSPAAAPGEMVCLQFQRAKVDIHVCSAHLISTKFTDATGVVHDGEDVRANQTRAIKDEAARWVKKGDFVIIGGDFNGKPNSPPLDKMYAPQLGGGGDFTEYNRKGAGRDGKVNATADGTNTEDGQPYSKKIDYVFFSTNRAPIDGPDIDLVDDASDHDMLTSAVQMKKKI